MYLKGLLPKGGGGPIGLFFWLPLNKLAASKTEMKGEQFEARAMEVNIVKQSMKKRIRELEGIIVRSKVVDQR